MAWRWLRAACILGLVSLGAAGPRPQGGVAYEVRPVLSDGRLTALDVEMRFRGPPQGGATLSLPLDSAEGHPHLTALSVEGGSLYDAGPDEKRLRAAPGAAVTIRYRLLPGSDKDPESESRAAVVRPDWFAVHGESAFITIEGQERTHATVTYGAGPAGWTLTGSFHGPTTLGGVREGLLVGGARYQELRRRVAGAELRLAYPPQAAASAMQTLDDIARVEAAERSFWRAPGEPFFVAIVPLSDDRQFGGRGLDGGFVLFLGERVPHKEWLHLLAHEHMHTWISRRIGGFPRTDSDREAWLNEGFTEAFTAQVLLSSGLWSPEAFAADQNAALLRYGVSPAKTAPNSLILADRNRDFDVNKLPYDRGRLLALIWDHRLRAATSGRSGLADVMRAQVRAAARNARAGADVSADRLFPQVARRLTGVDLSADIARYVEDGAAVVLPADVFGLCARVVDASQPNFDRGFDLGATMRAHGHLTGLEPGGPAARAGLHEGDRVLIDEIPSRNSQSLLTYVVVEPGGGRRTVRYLPQGVGEVTFQRLEFTSAARADPERCAHDLARP